jgi:hypothetical protein
LDTSVILAKWMYKTLAVPALTSISDNGTEKTRFAFLGNKSGRFVLNSMSSDSTLSRVRWLEGTVRLQYDDLSEKTSDKSIRGLYFAEYGTIYMKTIDQKRENWTDLLRYIAHTDQAQVVEEMLRKRDKDIRSNDSTHLDTQSHTNTSSRHSMHKLQEIWLAPRLSECEFGIIAQTEDLKDRMSASELRIAEEEWKKPTGLNSKKLSPYRIAGMVFSQNCNSTWEIEGRGLGIEHLQRKTLDYGFYMMIVRHRRTYSPCFSPE